METVKCAVLFLIVCCPFATFGLNERIRETSMKCVKEYKQPESLTDDIFSHKIYPESREGKCTMFCILKEMGYTDQNKKLLLDPMQVDASGRYSDDDELEKAQELNKVCVERAYPEENECEAGYKVISCLVTEYDKYNIQM